MPEFNSSTILEPSLAAPLSSTNGTAVLKFDPTHETFVQLLRKRPSDRRVAVIVVSGSRRRAVPRGYSGDKLHRGLVGDPRVACRAFKRDMQLE